MRRFLEWVRRKVWPPKWRWIAILLTIPLFYSITIFFLAWPNGVPDSVIEAYFGYGVLLIMILVWRMIKNPLSQLVPVVVLLASVGLLLATNSFISRLGFEFFIYPKESFLKNRCKISTFVEDGKSYEVGICDMKLDQSGQFDHFSLLYDTSGNAGVDEDVKEARKVKDKKEWVDAIRKVMKNDPNDQFEYTYFYSEKLWDNFYSISFEPGVSLGGFTQDYGPPPYDVHNPYQPMF